MSNRRHAASPPDAPPLWRANCCYGRNAFSHTEITLWTSSSIFSARRPTPRSAEGPRAFADDPEHLQMTVMKSGLESNRRAPFGHGGTSAIPGVN